VSAWHACQLKYWNNNTDKAQGREVFLIISFDWHCTISNPQLRLYVSSLHVLQFEEKFPLGWMSLVVVCYILERQHTTCSKNSHHFAQLQLSLGQGSWALQTTASCVNSQCHPRCLSKENCYKDTRLQMIGEHRWFLILSIDDTHTSRCPIHIEVL